MFMLIPDTYLTSHVRYLKYHCVAAYKCNGLAAYFSERKCCCMSKCSEFLSKKKLWRLQYHSCKVLWLCNILKCVPIILWMNFSQCTDVPLLTHFWSKSEVVFVRSHEFIYHRASLDLCVGQAIMHLFRGKHLRESCQSLFRRVLPLGSHLSNAPRQLFWSRKTKRWSKWIGRDS